VKGVLGAIFDSAKSQFSLTVYESNGVWGLTNTFVTCVKSFEATSEGAATHFSLTVYESHGAVLAAESIRHL
jgi:hypothetical protein